MDANVNPGRRSPRPAALPRQDRLKPMRGNSPTVAVGLGGGGARGIAHIALLEAIDELGLRVTAVAGCSMGAIVGAAYASGLTGADLRAHTLNILRDRSNVMGRLLKARVGRFLDVFAGRGINPVLIDGEIVLDHFWPEAVPDRFEELAVPFSAVATNFLARSEVMFDSGPLTPAVAASMAIPGLVRPVEINGQIFVDGGAVNPLPYLHLFGRADVVIGCDVTGGPVANSHAIPYPVEATFGAAQIMMATITNLMLKERPPDILVRPPVDHFRALDFFRAAQILAAAEGAKDEIKRGLALRLDKA
jgi:NTE family protein